MSQGKWAPSVELELALVNLVGPTYKRFADEALDPEKLRVALLVATDALEQKLKEAGAGEGFRHRCGEGLELFRHEVSKIWEESNNEWTLVARLLRRSPSSSAWARPSAGPPIPPATASPGRKRLRL